MRRGKPELDPSKPELGPDRRREAEQQPSWVIPAADIEAIEGAKGVIGNGALAEVRKGWIDGVPVALKGLQMLRTDAASVASNETGRFTWIPAWERRATLDGFMRECDLLRRCMHPNIVGFVGFVLDRKPYGPWLVMQHASAGTLHDLIYGEQHTCLRTEVGKLPLRTQLVAISGLYKALAFLATLLLIHRDIKPANILVCVQGGTLEKVLVADFGDAIEAPTMAVRATAGTPIYMAPEMCDENQVKDCKADVFSAGVVMVELNTGVVPHPERRPDDIASIRHSVIAELALRCIVNDAKSRANASQISTLIESAIDVAPSRDKIPAACAPSKFERLGIESVAEEGIPEVTQKATQEPETIEHAAAVTVMATAASAPVPGENHQLVTPHLREAVLGSGDTATSGGAMAFPYDGEQAIDAMLADMLGETTGVSAQDSDLGADVLTSGLQPHQPEPEPEPAPEPDPEPEPQPEPEPELELELELELEPTAEQQERAALQLLPLVPAAQRTRVVKRQQLLNPAHVGQLLRAAEELAPVCGRYARDAQGVAMQAASEVEGAWTTSYLHTAGACHRHPSLAPILKLLLAEAREVDAEQGWDLLKARDSDCGAVHWRNIEYHVVRPGGSLANEQHFDGGSLVTIDVMLAKTPTDFEGGEFTTPEGGSGYGRNAGVGEVARQHEFHQGDVLFFVSHKRHWVQPVTAGVRRVMVLELWHGPQRECSHRCLQRRGDCGHTG
eukprot:COSAG05_NODE_2036_length_3656_cov_61.922125_1_plen_731_part_00